MLDRRLQYVVSTARYGSFTAAAERIGVTQSAITKSVADLERQLGSVSVDFRLGTTFMMFEHSRHSYIDPRHPQSARGAGDPDAGRNRGQGR